MAFKDLLQQPHQLCTVSRCAADVERRRSALAAALVVLNDKGHEICRFNFFNAFIMEYAGPDFDAQSKDIAFESIKVHYDYFEIESASLAKVLAQEALSAGMGMLANSLHGG